MTSDSLLNSSCARASNRDGAQLLDREIRRLLDQQHGIEPTGVTRETYLDLAERIVRAGSQWQDEHGAIIDPVAGTEQAQSSPRFVSSGAVLLEFGRISELKERIFLGMDWCCARLAAGKAKSPDFWMRELMTAWRALAPIAPLDRRQSWEAAIRSIVPELIYTKVSPDGTGIDKLHNWTVYAAAGEALRELAGLAPEKECIWGARFYDKYMPAQLSHFSEFGMYRDPGDPFTYDMTTRLQFAIPLAAGFRSSPALDELLRLGGLSQLLYVSPDGLAPFGGRSNQIQIQEAILAALGELEAKRYRERDPALAGAFKRQAHLGVKSMSRWLLEMEPHRHVKNGFAPDSMHGVESYAGYAVYSLFTASCLVLAAQFADESIAESVTPAEVGGYVFELKPAFHKIFAVCGNTQIEIDTAADPAYDATGLGRFHRSGIPLELGLGMPLSANPKYKLTTEKPPAVPLALGPAWRLADEEEWIALAELKEPKSELRRCLESPDVVEFAMLWTDTSSDVRIEEKYRLTEGNLEIRVGVSHPTKKIGGVRLLIPLLLTNGQENARVEVESGKVSVGYLGCTYAAIFSSGYKMSMGSNCANRHGIYQPLIVEVCDARMDIQLMIERNGAATLTEGI